MNSKFVKGRHDSNYKYPGMNQVNNVLCEISLYKKRLQGSYV